jgi:hypothetical protein
LRCHFEKFYLPCFQPFASHRCKPPLLAVLKKPHTRLMQTARTNASETNPALVERVSLDLIAARHQPDHASYSAFVRETIAQYRDLLAHGLQVTPISGTVTGSSQELFDGLDHGRMIVAVDGSPMMPDHPLAQYLPEFGLTANVVFRIVHDVNGHYRTLSPFETFDGEVEAYRNHSRMYSAEAQAALYGETYAQLCHYYSGRGFVAVQKAAILPVRI